MNSTIAEPKQQQFDGSTAGVHQISILKDFSDDPFGRYPTDGPDNGERFREEILKSALREHNQVHVELNGNDYGSSFLEEAFGGLVRHGYFKAEILAKKLVVSHILDSYAVSVWTYINRAKFDSEE